MSFGKGSNTTTTTTKADPAAMGAYYEVLNKASAAANKPYQGWGGPWTEQANQYQTGAAEDVSGLWGGAQPYFTQAGTIAGEAGAPTTAADVSRWYNPAIEDVINATQRQFDERRGRAATADESKAAAIGALGGNRLGVQRALTEGELAREENATISGLYKDMYDQAARLAMADKQRQAGVAGTLSGIGSGYAGAGTNVGQTQFGLGEGLRGIGQADINAQIQEHYRALGYDAQTAAFLAQVAGSIGPQLGGTSTTEGPKPNMWTQLAGLGLTGLGMWLNPAGTAAGLATGAGSKLLSKDGGRIEKDSGGGVLGNIDVPGYIPTNLNLPIGKGLMPPPPKPPEQEKPDYKGMAKGLVALGDKARDWYNSPGNPLDLTAPNQGPSAGIGPISTGSDYMGFSGTDNYNPEGYAAGGGLDAVGPQQQPSPSVGISALQRPSAPMQMPTPSSAFSQMFAPLYSQMSAQMPAPAQMPPAPQQPSAGVDSGQTSPQSGFDPQQFLSRLYQMSPISSLGQLASGKVQPQQFMAGLAQNNPLMALSRYAGQRMQGGYRPQRPSQYGRFGGFGGLAGRPGFDDGGGTPISVGLSGNAFEEDPFGEENRVKGIDMLRNLMTPSGAGSPSQEDRALGTEKLKGLMAPPPEAPAQPRNFNYSNEPVLAINREGDTSDKFDDITRVSAYAPEEPTGVGLATDHPLADVPAGEGSQLAALRRPGISIRPGVTTRPVVTSGVGSQRAIPGTAGGFGGISGLSDILNPSGEARQGLIAMGLSMMANQRGGPGSFLSALGEGGQQGMTAYSLAKNATAAAQAQARKEALERRKEAFEREKFDRPYREMTAAEKLRANREGLPAGYERKPDGSVGYIVNGPADPAVLERNEAIKKKFGPPRQMTVSDITKLSEQGGKLGRINYFAESFKPEYAGYGAEAIGNAMTFLGRNLPSTVPENVKLAAQWWQTYDAFKNIVRNELFGSALTPPEKAAFERADVNAGMDPETVKANLLMQQKITQNGIRRTAQTLILAGYDPRVVTSAFNIKEDEIGKYHDIGKPIPTQKDIDYAKNNPAARELFIKEFGREP